MFDAIIDARSPAEFAEDHIPGAINCPVLDDAERARVGVLYKQVSPFAARVAGAPLIARNIARHIDERFADRPRTWTPLVYCWRGGQRSGAFTHILREIGWNAQRLEGGHKSWRHHVVAELEALPGRFSFRILSGPTGSGKSRVLEALARQGAQVLHLEELAAHRGSVLGPLPDRPQPPQKLFETRLHAALSQLDPARPVYAEAESRRIGSIHLPNAMIEALRAAPCLLIDAPAAARVEFLLRDYAHYLDTPAGLGTRLSHLKGLQSNETLGRWQALVAAGDFPALVAELLELHYDPLYQRSQAHNFRDYRQAPRYTSADLSPNGIEALAAAIRAGVDEPENRT
ncbi:tRNA 2-selenouridine(34) synthase MnmH [Denitratisoma sp. DHT3]|uniref:tRNA 2-selenouridine(34) synthase MnmH n=1 Tax=Denitratisoma sp. DHT3 TaxID=1981880 RepID=UPI0039658C07